MKLRLYARPGYLFSMPGPRVMGTHPRYIGRYLKVDGQRISNPAVNEPVEIELDTKPGQRVLRVMIADGADHPLWAADKETAKVCGVPFVEVEHVDGEWQPKSTKSGPRPVKAEVA